MRGRKPLPTHLKVIKGTARKDRLPKNEPRPEGALLHPPKGMSPRQRVVWAHAIAESPPGLLKPVDRGVVAAYVIGLETALEINEQMATAPLLVRIGGTEEAPIMGPNPLERIRMQNLLAMIRAAEQIGFSPSARSRIEIVSDVVDAEAAVWDEILGDQ